MAAERRRESLKARRAGVAAAAIGATAVVAPSAQAANLQVTTTTDSVAGSLRAAITTANGNAQPDTITFASGVIGTIHLSGGQLPITAPTASDSLTISGPGRDVLAVSGDGNSDGTPDTRIFNIAQPGAGTPKVAISGLTLTKGTTAPTPPFNGGAIFAGTGSDTTVSSSAITGSTSPTGSGAGIYSQGELAVSDTNVTGNSAATGSGGGIDTSGANRTNLTVSNSTISGNSAVVAGGVRSGGGLAMTGSTVSGNTATNIGGGILHSGKYPILVTDSTISGNSAPRGGGLAMGSTKYGGLSRVSGTTISGNTASVYGAGVYVNNLSGGDRFTITHSTISGNNGGAGSFGGGIEVYGNVSGEFDLVDSTVSGNTAASGAGVGIGIGSGTVPTVRPNAYIALYNSTIAANNASAKGGGVYLGQYNTGGGNQSATIVAGSTIVADNTAAGSAQDLDRADGSGSGGFNLAFSLVEAPGDAPLTQTPPGSSIVGQDPLLGPLAGNGGPTQTELPAQTSPVVDKGDSPPLLTTDQRGDPRRVDLAGVPNASDGTDIGAVELAPDTTPPNTKIKKKPKKKIKTPKKKIKVKVAFTSSESGSTFQCKFDKGKFKTCKSPFKPKASSKFGKGKKHTIQIRAIDAAGNVDPTPAKVKFTVIRKH